MKYKAEKIETYRDKYFTTIEYSYRGRKYEVEYANGINCLVTPAYIQHRDAQEKIDKAIEEEGNTKKENYKPFDADEIFELLGWN